MLEDAEPTVDDLDAILCPLAFRGDAVRALHGATEEVAHALRGLEARAAELRLPVYARRVAGIRRQVEEAVAELRRVPR